MKKKIEAKILEELKDRVFQQDINIKKRHEEQDLNDATKEALKDMTELPLSEISRLEKEVRLEIVQRRQRNIKRLWVYGIIFAILTSNLYYFAGPYQYNDSLVFEDDFDNNGNSWPIYDDYSSNRYFEDGSYIFISNKHDSIYEDEISLTMPKFFTLEVKTTWLGGQYDPYGLKLHLGHGRSFHLFQLHPKNKTSIKYYSDRKVYKWLVHKENADSIKHSHVQKIEIRPYHWPGGNAFREGRLKYYVNDELLANRVYIDKSVSGNPDYPQPRLSFFVSGKQKVSFDYLKITDDRSGKLIFEGNFDEIKDRLHPNMIYKKYTYLYKGKYYFDTDHKGQCYRAVLPREFKKHAKIKLTGTWLKGEDYYYGMILQKDLDNYYAFELKQSGTACFVKRIDGKDVTFVDNIQTNLTGTDNKDFDITVFLKGSQLEYYVNDQLVCEGKYDMPVKAFGMRVCGSQSVKFDRIEIRESV